MTCPHCSADERYLERVQTDPGRVLCTCCGRVSAEGEIVRASALAAFYAGLARKGEP
jgi:transcription initiation factor TFIIIB Brf1 subunit/transcription initiation factor TFIIB